MALIETKVIFELPETEKEIKLAQIWSELLNIDENKIGRQTSFFELGGDSISSIQLVARCKSIGIHLTTVLIFRKSTLSQMAKLTEDVNQDLGYNPIIIS